ncbi:uncharacterized protein LOC114183052 isoform X2 [Vigna unguiculata]|uniref:uncharacterized protein LOC114183052 isoform X2 n=1 Tax=Vigna unguiculata TaxID=3917 RepID=UPI0010161167|nr:uncharacterized protein LOC114183052 isoform X2 [Vigna unguiculata]
MDAVVSTTTEGGLKIVGHVVKRQLGYFFSYKDKFKELEFYIEKLEHNKERLQHRVDNALRNAEEIENDIQHCLKEMDEKIKEYKSYINDKCHEKTICSISFFPNNFRSRYQLGRKATKMVDEIIRDELWKTSKIENVSYRESPSTNVVFSNTGYESFASRTRTMEMIMKALEDSTVDMIGVYGPGGVGKTTLVLEIAKKTREKKLFKTVVMANVTRNPDTKKIQGQIADVLGMRLEEESEIARADHIRKRLKNEKENVLIILDDLWDGLDLNKLGIPCNDDNLDDVSQNEVNDIFDGGYNDNISNFGYNKTKPKKLPEVYLNKMKREKLSSSYKGGKILLTSRNKQVLCNQMDVQLSSTFSVGVLEEKEAETLLKKVADVKNSEFDRNATEIAKWSAGFPIALVSIGRTLKHKSLSTWDDVCQQIKRQSFTEKWGFTNFSIKLSYDYLENEELKCIFLHCARMGNDALIMDLVKFCIGLNLLPGVDTITEARKRVKEMIHELEESSLLVRSYSIDRFNMHDIVRDVALLISSKEKHVFFMKDAILDEWPHEDDVKRYTAIFLLYCDINELPESIHCPRLEVLHIDNKNESLEIPDHFFESMIRLRVLVLTNVNLSCLPSSIKCLKKLRMLCLERCTLEKNLSIIGELKNLRILSLLGSNIENLPPGFGQLDKLQLFDISNCLKLREIRSNIIPRINTLEEFYTRDSPILWAEENIKSENASLSELRHLNQLQNLDIRIQSSSHFLQLFFDNLNSYKIVIGEFDFLNLLKVGEFKIPDKYEEVKFLALDLKEGIDIHSETWVKMLFKSVECLLLGELNDVQDIYYELNVEGFPNLKHLSIVNNFGIKYIINPVDQFQLLFVFPKLESIWLYKMDTLEKICGNWLAETSFRSLKVIKIKTCVKLVNLFPFSIVRLLIALETIEVYDCDSFKGIVSEERQTHTVIDDKIEFPQLRLLTLNSLPIFTCLYVIDKMFGSPQSLKDLQDINKDIVTDVENKVTNSCLPLFNEKVSFPKLEWLELSSLNIKKIWSDQFDHCFQNLLTLNVINCGNLKYLLSCSMAGSLVNLQSLFVSKCEVMEDIFHSEDVEYIDVFPKLKKMEIICMEKLATIWKSHIGLHSFCSLDSLIIRECHKLVTIFPSYMGQRFQSLHSLIITNCNLVENIFDFANIPQTCDLIETNLDNIILEMLPNLVNVWKDDICKILKYNNLRSIRVFMSPNLKYIFPLSVALDLEKLEVLEVHICWAVKEIIVWDKHSSENVINFKFPRLNTLSLMDLYGLRSFYSRTHTLEWPQLKKLDIVDCSRLEGLTSKITNSQVQPIVLATKKVALEYLKHVRLIDYPETKGVRYGKPIFQDNLFNCLQKLEVDAAFKRDILIPRHVLPYLKNVKELLVHDSDTVHVIFEIDETDVKTNGMVFRLEKLTLTNLPNLKCVWNENPKEIVNFPYLQEVYVKGCGSLVTLFSLSLAKNLEKLKKLEVQECEKLVEIVEKGDAMKHGTTVIFIFPCLSILILSIMPLLSCFYLGKHHLECPLLDTLYISYCPQLKLFISNLDDGQKGAIEAPISPAQQPLFSIEILASSKLKNLQLNVKNIMLLSDAQLPPDLLYKLKVLWLCFEDYNNEKGTLPFDFFHRVPNLEHFILQTCSGVKEIFPAQKPQVHDTIFKGLKQLFLNVVPDLDWVGLEHTWVQPYSEKLELLQLYHCRRVEKIVYCAVSFINLKELQVVHCERMVYLFTFSTLKTLVKLETLIVGECESIKEIVKNEDEDGCDEIVFERLTLIQLNCLPRLVSFYSGNATLQCSCLNNVLVTECPNMTTFSLGIINVTSFKNIHTSIEDSDLLLENDLNTVIEKSFHTKDFFDYSKRMILDDYLERTGVQHKNPVISINFFGSFKKLEFDATCKRVIVIPSHILPYLRNLEELNVHSSDVVQVIFDTDETEVETRGIIFGLKKLTLKHLSNLKCVWKKNLEGIVSFSNLEEVNVDGCGSLVTLFPLSLAKNLGKLWSLELKRCEKMVEIVGREDNGTTIMFEFPRLSFLYLKNMPLLSCFYPRKHYLECPLLGSLLVECCPKLKLFTSDSDDSHKDEVIEAPIKPLQQPLFSIEKVSPKLMGLTLNEENIKLMSDARWPQDLSKLFILILSFEDDNNGKDSLPFDFFHKVPNLFYLTVQKWFGMKEIFPSQKLQVHDNVLAGLKQLSLWELSELESIGLEHTWVQPYSTKLEWLKLGTCPRVEKIVSCAVSFINLKKLSVKHCEKMEYLFTFATLKSLVKLETLSIKECESIKEIAKEEDEDGCDEMVFGRLRSIKLNFLPKLICFYSGNATLQFSYLKTVMVAKCPNMKTFSEGVTKVPIFLEIKTSKDSDLTFHDDLNTTIQR